MMSDASGSTVIPGCGRDFFTSALLGLGGTVGRLVLVLGEGEGEGEGMGEEGSVFTSLRTHVCIVSSSSSFSVPGRTYIT